jgi:hypothetical protein
MKRKSIISGIRNSLVSARARTLAPWRRSMQARVEVGFDNSFLWKFSELEAEHGVDPSARRLDRRLSALQRRKRGLLGGWRRTHGLLGSLLDGRLRREGRRDCSTGSCEARGSGRLGTKLLEVGDIARLFRARLNSGK